MKNEEKVIKYCMTSKRKGLITVWAQAELKEVLDDFFQTLDLPAAHRGTSTKKGYTFKIKVENDRLTTWYEDLVGADYVVAFRSYLEVKNITLLLASKWEI